MSTRGAPVEEGAPDETSAIVVPSASYSTLADAVAGAADGTRIKVLAGHTEVLCQALIIDRAVFIEGPEDGSCHIRGEEGIVVAAGPVRQSVLLRHISVTSTVAPALVIVGGCTIEACVIEASGIGIEIAAHAGSSVCIRQSLVHRCRVGISLSGGAAALLEDTRVQRCDCGVAITGLVIREGWNEVLGSLSGGDFESNADADLLLRAWSIRERDSDVVRYAPSGGSAGEVAVRGWPREACSVVAQTDSNVVVLAFRGGEVNATLFDGDDGSPLDASTSTSAADAGAEADAGSAGADGADEDVFGMAESQTREP